MNVFNPPIRTIDEWRIASSKFGKEVGERASISSRDFNVPAKDGFSIPCTLFNDDLSNDTPVFVFYPGCCFIFDFVEVNSVIASQIASLAKVKVLLVNHRLAPENSIMTCLSDCCEAASYASNLLGSKIIIGGWSSGAHAASHVANKVSFKIFHQILLAGSFDYTHSYHEFDAQEAKDPTLDRRMVAHFASLFFKTSNFKDPEFSPFWHNDFSHYPPTTLLCGENDAFRNDTESFTAKLKNSSVPVEKIVLAGQCHNSIVMRKQVDSNDPIRVIADLILRLK